MNYYKDNQNNVFAYSDIQRPKDGLIKITEQEALELTNPTSGEPYIPSQVTRRQGRLALLSVGKLAEVELMIASIEDPIMAMEAQVEYEADTWERGNEFLQSMWMALGGSEEELDELFILASTK